MNTVPRLPRLSRCRNGYYQTYLRNTLASRHTPCAPFTSSSIRTSIIADQTKKSNDPEEAQKEGHHKQATKTTSGEDRGHPGKQPDPQPSPSKSTGVRSEGPESKSGVGREPRVHKEKPAGAGQHTG